MANWLEQQGFVYDRDWENVVRHDVCDDLHTSFRGKYSRPDFRLIGLESSIQALILLGNDEFMHRRRHCEFNRMIKIASALERGPATRGVPLVYIRFNPHWFTVNDVFHDPPLSTRYEKLGEVIKQLQSGALALEPGLNIIYMFYDKDLKPGIRRDESLASSLTLFRTVGLEYSDPEALMCMASRVRLVV